MNRKPYLDLLRSNSLRDVSFGGTRIRLFYEHELDQAQVGYSVDDRDNLLSGGNDGDWKDSWLVIGYEDLCGDPIMIDLAVDGLPVLTAPHGEGDWAPETIAENFPAFVKILHLIQTVSTDRENPVRLEANPLTPMERATFLTELRSISPNSSTEFWEIMIA